MTYRRLLPSEINDAALKEVLDRASNLLACDADLRKVFERADNLLYDAYGMFKLPGAAKGDSGGCTLSIPLVLLCVIDSLAAEVYPIEPRGMDKREKRFKKFVRDKLFEEGQWQPPDKDNIAKFLYLELRNSLVHEMGGDSYAKHRKGGLAEPNAGKWGKIEPSERNIERLDNYDGKFPKEWPAVYLDEDKDPHRMKVCCAALYCALKRTIAKYLEDEQAMQYTRNKRAAP